MRQRTIAYVAPFSTFDAGAMSTGFLYATRGKPRAIDKQHTQSIYGVDMLISGSHFMYRSIETTCNSCLLLN